MNMEEIQDETITIVSDAVENLGKLNRLWYTNCEHVRYVGPNSKRYWLTESAEQVT